MGISLTRVQKVFGGKVHAVNGVSLQIDAGDFVAILGPSGCGKSTILRMIAGLDRPTEGSIDVERRDADASIAYVFQDPILLPWRNAIQNVELPMELAGIDKRQRTPQARAAVVSVGLEAFELAYPAQLSGGMRMRVSLARALVTNPQVLLLDEPFAALDEITRQGLDDQLRMLWQERRMTVAFVTHAITEAAYLAERAVVLSRRPAQVTMQYRLDLPACRSLPLRTSDQFAAQCRVLSEALVRGTS